VEGSFEHGNEPSGSIKCSEILRKLRDWQLLKKDSVPSSWLIGWFVGWLVGWLVGCSLKIMSKKIEERCGPHVFYRSRGIQDNLSLP
jgi:hypothetical protein